MSRGERKGEELGRGGEERRGERGEEENKVE